MILKVSTCPPYEELHVSTQCKEYSQPLPAFEHFCCGRSRSLSSNLTTASMARLPAATPYPPLNPFGALPTDLNGDSKDSDMQVRRTGRGLSFAGRTRRLVGR
jgi:hypothetical protein